jgi:hypothetical protein
MPSSSCCQFATTAKKNPTSSLIAIRKEEEEEEVSKGHLHHQFQDSHISLRFNTIGQREEVIRKKKRNCRISAAKKFDIPRSMIVQPH